MIRPHIIGCALALVFATTIAVAAPTSAAGEDNAVGESTSTSQQVSTPASMNTSSAEAPVPVAAPDPVAADASDSSLAADAAQSDNARHPTPSPRAATVSIAANKSTIVYGQSVVLSGVIGPAAAEPLTIERWSKTGWISVTTATTDAGGAWTATVNPAATWGFRARMDDNSATSGTVVVNVQPKVTVVRKSRGTTFVGVPVRIRIQPASYRGRVNFSVRWAKRFRARVAYRPSATGIIAKRLPAPGIGQMTVFMKLNAANNFTTRHITFHTNASVKSIGPGSRGPAVAGLVRRLAALRFHTPGPTMRYDHRVQDVVLAFHKSQRMTRTGTMTYQSWRRMALASPLRPKYASPRNHIEVDKTRQILKVVKNGKVLGALHVSTGATGNTPVGRWRVYQKGGSYLYKFMAFIGNYGIHGYVPVPSFPASHGCVREPMWIAAWTFRHTPMGTTVYVHN